MENRLGQDGIEQKKTFLMRDGRLYFSKTTERKFFFVLTVIMLICGVLAKIGVL